MSTTRLSSAQLNLIRENRRRARMRTFIRTRQSVRDIKRDTDYVRGLVLTQTLRKLKEVNEYAA